MFEVLRLVLRTAFGWLVDWARAENSKQHDHGDGSVGVDVRHRFAGTWICPSCGHRCTYCKRLLIEPSDPPTNPRIRRNTKG